MIVDSLVYFCCIVGCLISNERVGKLSRSVRPLHLELKSINDPGSMERKTLAFSLISMPKWTRRARSLWVDPFSYLTWSRDDKVTWIGGEFPLDCPNTDTISLCIDKTRYE